jgi:TolA-binding protein
MSEKSETFQGLDRLNRVVIRRMGVGDEESPTLIVAICDAPTFVLVDSAGNRYHWRQDLTRPATPTESIDYWRERAMKVEESHKRVLETLQKALDQNQQLIERLNEKNSEQEPIAT